MPVCGECKHRSPSDAGFCEGCGAELPAPVDIRFKFLCSRDFHELAGESDRERFCDTCQQRVYNLDPLTPDERRALLQRSEGETCVSLTVHGSAARPCEPESHSERRAFRLTGPSLVPRQQLPLPPLPVEQRASPITVSVAAGGSVLGRLVAGELVIPLFLGRTSIGSAPENDVVVSDPWISGRHCLVESSEGEVLLSDLGSMNGILLNGEDILDDCRRLVGGDVVRMGQLEWRFERAPDA